MRFEAGRILVNGYYTDLGDDMMAYCSLADEATELIKPGDTYRSEPYESS